MKPAEDLCTDLARFDWFASIGVGDCPEFEFPTRTELSLNGAILGFSSEVWADVRTEAQGDLTGFLARHRNDLYGGYWNDVARSTNALVADNARDAVSRALARHALPADWLGPVLLDLTRACIEAAYRRVVPRAPAFFERLLVVYAHGRLPCGWDGSLDQWPAGRLLVY
jgi:hypothetical protein